MSSCNHAAATGAESQQHLYRQPCVTIMQHKLRRQHACMQLLQQPRTSYHRLCCCRCCCCCVLWQHRAILLPQHLHHTYACGQVMNVAIGATGASTMAAFENATDSMHEAWQARAQGQPPQSSYAETCYAPTLVARFRDLTN